MKRIFAGAVAMWLFVAAYVAGGYAASKSYQFTGVVKAVDSGTVTVEKSAKETWQFELAKDTKGAPPKIGDRVTVFYKMVTTEIDPSAVPSAPKKK